MVDLALQGKRWGEIAGLQTDDITFTEGYTAISIRRQVNKDGKVTPKTKTEIAKGPFAIDRRLAERLWLHIMDPDRPETSWVFPNLSGGQLHHSDWSRDFWRPAVRNSEFAGLQFHDLKKIANHILGPNVDDKVRQLRMGTASATVLNDNYTMLSNLADRRAANRVGDVLYGTEEERVS
jgi:integrase